MDNELLYCFTYLGSQNPMGHHKFELHGVENTISTAGSDFTPFVLSNRKIVLRSPYPNWLEPYIDMCGATRNGIGKIANSHQYHAEK